MVEKILSGVDRLQPPPRILTFFQRRARVILIAAAVFPYAYQLLIFRADFRRWDYMYVSGYTALMVGLWLSLDLRQRIEAALKRLVNRGALEVSGGAERLLHDLEARADVFSQRTGVVVAAVICAAFLVGMWSVYGPLVVVPSTLGATIAAYIAGRVLGRIVSYGSLGGFLHRAGHELKAQPGHLDRSCGLKPLGDLFFFQAMIAAIPALHLSVWSLLIPAWPLRDYSYWTEEYLGLLVIAIAFVVLAFVMPMVSVHKDMKKAKTQYLQQADQLSAEINELQRKLEELEPAGGRDALNDQLMVKMQRFQDIEKMPTWPVDLPTIRRFTFSNVALSVPLLVQLLVPASIQGPVSDALRELLTSLAQ